MFTKNRSVLQAMLVVAAITFIVGCSTSAKKPKGASARAVKGMDTVVVDSGDFEPRETVSSKIPLNELDPSLCARINFDYDKSAIKPEFTACLNKVAAFLSANPDIKVLIEGHCDERGTEEYNIALGEKRSMTTVEYLVARGVSASRLSTSSKGELEPLALGSNEAAWKQNRRAEFFAIQ